MRGIRKKIRLEKNWKILVGGVGSSGGGGSENLPGKSKPPTTNMSIVVVSTIHLIS